MGNASITTSASKLTTAKTTEEILAKYQPQKDENRKTSRPFEKLFTDIPRPRGKSNRSNDNSQIAQSISPRAEGQPAFNKLFEQKVPLKKPKSAKISGK